MVTRKADGWYVTLTLEDKSVPDAPTINIKPNDANSIGVDAGLEYFVACSDGELKEPPKFYRKAEESLSKLQAKREASAGVAEIKQQLEPSKFRRLTEFCHRSNGRAYMNATKLSAIAYLQSPKAPSALGFSRRSS